MTFLNFNTMKTQLRKIALAAAIGLSFVLPKGSFAQDDQDPYYQAQYGTNYDNDQQNVAPEDQQVTTQTFYDGLSPYGQWVNYGTYGYVWIPNAGPNFVPYSTAGHWIYTDYGWTWASDYDWGWAPFHYGRWTYDSYYGWMWIPGTEWAPAWVAWRNCDGYYGWAPLCPGIDISVGYYSDYAIPLNYWMFVDAAYITSPWVYRYYEPRRHCEDLYRRSVVISRTNYDDRHRFAYVSGPDRKEVEGYTHTPVRAVSVRPTSKPGQQYDVSHLHLYRPTVSTPSRESGRPVPAPTRTVNTNQVPQRTVQYGDIRTNTNYQQHVYTQPVSNNPRPQPSYNRGGGATQPRSVPQRTFGGSRPAPAPVRSSGGGARHR